MKILTGTVENGRVVVDDESLPEGSKVTILAPEGAQHFSVTPKEKALLRESLAEAERGQLLSSDELLRELDDDARSAVDAC
jgi:hypothetical protein